MLRFAASIFTYHWAKNHSNPEVKGFKKNAEDCYQKMMRRNVAFIFLVPTLLLCLYRAIVNGTGPIETSNFLWWFVPVLVSCCGLVFTWSQKLGNSSKEIAIAWKHARRQLRKFGVLERAPAESHTLETGHIRRYTDDERLILAFDWTLDALARVTLAHENEQDQKKVFHRKRMDSFCVFAQKCFNVTLRIGNAFNGTPNFTVTRDRLVRLNGQTFQTGEL